MTDKEKIIQWFSDIAEMCSRLTTGNVSHLGATIKGKAIRAAEYIEKHSLPEEPVSEDLEEAAEKYAFPEGKDKYGIEEAESNGIYFREEKIKHFKAGAEWQKQAMKDALQTEYEKGRFDMRKEIMKDAVEGEIVYQIGSAEIAQTDIRYKVMSDRVYIPNVKLGDKVKIIIIKPEQQ